MKRILYLAFVPALLIAAVSCQKDNPNSKNFLYRQWEEMAPDASTTFSILDISKKQMIWKVVSHSSIALPELMYDDSHRFALKDIRKRTDEEGVWEIFDTYGNSYFIFDVTEKSAKFSPYSLDRTDYSLLVPVSPKVKLTYHYVPASAIDLGFDVYWARFNLPESFPSEDFDPEKDYYDNWCWDELAQHEFYNPGDHFVAGNAETDIVHERLGGKWRMPTSEEWNQLYYDVDWYFSGADEDFKWNRVSGWGRKPGYEGAYIELSMDGYFQINAGKKEDSYGFYWTGTPGSNASMAYWVKVKNNGMEITEAPRFNKCNIRPVWDPNM